MSTLQRLAPVLGLLGSVAALGWMRYHDSRYNELAVWKYLYLLGSMATAYFTYVVYIYPFLLSPLRHLPGPSGWRSLNPFWGYDLVFFARQPQGIQALEWIESIPNDGIIAFRGVGNIHTLLVTSPLGLSEVLNINSYDFGKMPEVRKFLSRFLGMGVLLTEGAQHKVQRKNLSPAFHVRHIRELTSIFWRKSVELIDTMEARVFAEGPKGDCEFGDWASRATLDIIGLAGMGHEFRAITEPHQELVEKYSNLLDPSPQKLLLYFVHLVVPTWLIDLLPWQANRDFLDITRTLRRLAHSLVQEKKIKLANDKERVDKDILSVALESGVFTEDDMVAQLLTFLGAGHETTASALTWAIHKLTEHPDMQSRLRAEVRSMLPSPRSTSSNISYPTWDDIEALTYLNAIVNETLRYIPVIPAMARVAKVDVTIQGIRVPKGTRIVLAPWVTNRSARLWGSDAHVFNPERYMAPGAGNSGGATSNYAMMSFSHGPRSCIGQAFARGEFKCLLAALIGRFEFEMQEPGKKLEIRSVVTTKPVEGLNVRMKVIPGW